MADWPRFIEIEIQSWVFVGRVNELVREALLERANDRANGGTVLMNRRANNEQGFAPRAWQPKHYVSVIMEGI